LDVEKEYINGHIRLAPLLRKLADMGLPVKDTTISYKSHLDSMFIFVGKDPILEDFTINY
jgi:hypothetical protein